MLTCTAGLLGLLTQASPAQAQAFSSKYVTLPLRGAAQPAVCTEEIARIMGKLGWKVVGKEKSAETGTLIVRAGQGVFVTAFCTLQSRTVYLTAINPDRNDSSPRHALIQVVNQLKKER